MCGINEVKWKKLNKWDWKWLEIQSTGKKLENLGNLCFVPNIYWHDSTACHLSLLVYLHVWYAKRKWLFFIDARFIYVVQFEDVMAAVKFTWMNELKRSGSFVIGSSPEFDLALYTLCFLSRRGRNTCDVCIYIIVLPSFQYLLYRSIHLRSCG